MEMASGGVASASAVDVGGMHSGHGTHAVSPAAEGSEHGPPHDHASHDGHAGHADASPDSESSGACCCATCGCAATGVGLVPAFGVPVLESPATAAGTRMVPREPHSALTAFLLPYPNGPPEVAV